MTTKTAARQNVKQTTKKPEKDDLRMALEIHTLSQLLYHHIAATHPWMPASPMMRPTAPFAANPLIPHGGFSPWGFKR